MAFAQSFYNQSSVLSINVLVVDDDPIFLQIMSRMLEKSKHRDPSVMEITVIAANDPMEALSTLKIQRNNIDLIITDYYMPGMNGLQLKRQINEEHGNLPVIVMSSDIDKEEESLNCGAISFLPKPIKPIDLPQIYQYALTCKRNGKSILWTDPQNHKDTYVSVPQQIQLLPEQTYVSVPQQTELLPEQTNVSVPQQTELVPEQANVAKTKKKYSSRSDSISGSSTNTNSSCVSTDGSRKNGKRKDSDSSGDDEPKPPSKKRKVKWTDELHHLFLRAIRHIGLDKAVPKKILEFMNVPYLTRENVASHLQKYRIFLRKVAEQALLSSSVFTGRGIDSNFSYAHFTEPCHNYYTPSSSWYDTTLTNRSFYSKPAGHGLGQSRDGVGQSRLLSNTHDRVRFNQTTPYNYMNRSSIYEPNRIGSNLTMPIKTNVNVSNQPSQNEGRRSFFEPTATANKTGQTSQVLGFGQHEPAATKVTSLNNNMMNSYGSLTSNQPGLSSYGSLTPNQSGLMSSYGPNQLGPSSYGSLTPTQPGRSSYGSSTPSQPGLSSYGRLTPNQSGLMSSYESLTPNQSRSRSYGSLTPNQSGPSSYGSVTPTQARLMSSYGSVTPSQPGLMSSYGSSTPNQSGPSSYGSLTPTQARLSSYGSVTPTRPGLMNSCGSSTPNQTGPSHFSYGMKSLLDHGNKGYKPPQLHSNATKQPNLEIPELENLNLYDDLGNINDLPCETSNFQFDHNKKQGEAASTNFELPTFPAEMNQIFSLEENDDWTFVNIDQGPSNGETPTTFAAPETNSSVFNMNPNHNKDEDVSDFFDWSILDAQDLVDDDFMDSLFNNDMN